jgi:uncharacterized protein YecT (DUF1311 family)
MTMFNVFAGQGKALSAGLCCAWLLMSASAGHAQAVRCNPSGSTIELAACAQASFERADRELNIVYSRLMRKAQTMDKSGAPDDLDKAVDRVRKAQRAWVAWRDTECQLRSLVNKGGSIERIEWPSCSAELTQERVKVLEDVLKGTE